MLNSSTAKLAQVVNEKMVSVRKNEYKEIKMAVYICSVECRREVLNVSIRWKWASFVFMFNLKIIYFCVHVWIQFNIQNVENLSSFRDVLA